MCVCVCVCVCVRAIAIVTTDDCYKQWYIHVLVNWIA